MEDDVLTISSLINDVVWKWICIILQFVMYFIKGGLNYVSFLNFIKKLFHFIDLKR